jgi:glucose-1-phosphatase
LTLLFHFMLILNPQIPHHHSIKNIIFDFGGVICDIDISRSEEKFKAFGPPKTISALSKKEQDHEFEKMVNQLETGMMTPAKFRQTIREFYISEPSDEAIDKAWNALVLGIPPHRIKLLENIRDHYRIFLLSNSNEIHYLEYLQDFQRKYGYHDFNDLFEKSWFSFRVRLKKPDRELFELALTDGHLAPEETLFIDDTLIHIESARKLGINGWYLKQGTDIWDLFEDLN